MGWLSTSKALAPAGGGRNDDDEPEPNISSASAAAADSAPTNPDQNPTDGRDNHKDTLSVRTYLGHANEVLYSAAENTYSSVTNALSSMYTGGGGAIDTSLGVDPGHGTAGGTGSVHGSDDTSQTGSIRSKRKGSLFTSYPGLLSLFRNPHSNTRSVNQRPFHSPTSVYAVRSLLSVVPPPLPVPPSHDQDGNKGQDEDGSHDSQNQLQHDQKRENPLAASVQSLLPMPTPSPSSSETAAQLAEGTLRAVRDIALDEAVLLHAALRHWSYRWERPFLSWLEAGPFVWWSENGYQHHEVGQKVSKIQAVLARRCAAIGDLQQHLLRAGWQRGVAQWGVLGDGGDWAAVAGIDGTMSQQPDIPVHTTSEIKSKCFDRVPSEISNASHSDHEDALLPSYSSSYVQDLPEVRSRHNSLYFANIFVKKKHDGQVFIDDPALAEWSVHAVDIVRRQLHRAGNGLIELPYQENWITDQEDSHTVGEPGAILIASEEEPPRSNVGHSTPKRIPLWATLTSVTKNSVDGGGSRTQVTQRMSITDLSLMAEEISELLNVMEGVMQIQYDRRLQKLRPPNRLRRNWLLVATIVPSMCYLMSKACSKDYGWEFFKAIGFQIVSFFREHVSEPVAAIFTELFKGTVNISDREARNVAIVTLKEMIRSWLDENFPEMPLAERVRRSEMMDMSLIETRKAQSMKSVYELNNVIRMSFIEAQFLKKEMMNALLALDEMQASNNINMNLGAVTPALLLLYYAKRMFQFLFYALLKLGKSREETYGSFLHILTEIERLLVMRDSPPTPPLLNSDSYDHRRLAVDDDRTDEGSNSVLNADDLGMLMLHLHELRTILLQRRSRFSSDIIRSVSEDLAELAGERGAVSVRQQLQVISRMCRTYPFLKVVSSRMFFEYAKGS